MPGRVIDPAFTMRQKADLDKNSQRARDERRRRQEKRKYRINMQNRTRLLFLFTAAAFVGLAVRLYFINRDNGDAYKRQVLSQQSYDSETLAYKRGNITDTKGTVLATSIQVFNVVVDSKAILADASYLEPTMAALRQAFGDSVDIDAIRSYISEHPDSRYYVVARNVPYEQKNAFEELANPSEDKKSTSSTVNEDSSNNAGEDGSTNAESNSGGENSTAGEENSDSETGTGGEDGSSSENDTGSEESGNSESGTTDGDNSSASGKSTSAGIDSGKIQGVWFEEGYIRSYPNETLASDVVGYADNDNNGHFGLEEYYNDTLNGKTGRVYGYLDQSSTLEKTTIEATNGNNLVTTIDANVQSIVEKYLKKFNDEHVNKVRDGYGARNLGCIIMEVNTGNVLAMASYPNFNLNDPQNSAPIVGMNKLDEKDNPTDEVMTQEDVDNLSDEDLPRYLNALWRNFCISDPYEPGSTAKPFTVASALDSGVITGNETYLCEGHLKVGGETGSDIYCHNRYGDGLLTVGEAIERSCNVALMDIALAEGKSIFCDYQKRFNFGLKTNIDLAGEVRTVSLIYAEEDMQITDLATNSFGQNFNVTMIQMITGFCSLINGGNYYEPHVVSKITSPSGATIENIEPRVLKKTVSESVSAKIREYCNLVVTGEHGTGKTARPAGYMIGGKTGTAETLPRQNGQYVVSFMGYAPADDPQIAIYVVVDRANEESQDDAKYATGIVRNILTEVLPYLNIYMTEELTEEERAELEALQLSDTLALGKNADISEKPADETEEGAGTEDGQSTEGDAAAGEAAGEESAAEGTSGENAGEAESTAEIWMSFETDPETGYKIDPNTGALVDPDTGYVFGSVTESSGTAQSGDGTSQSGDVTAQSGTAAATDAAAAQVTQGEAAQTGNATEAAVQAAGQ